MKDGHLLNPGILVVVWMRNLTSTPHVVTEFTDGVAPKTGTVNTPVGLTILPHVGTPSVKSR